MSKKNKKKNIKRYLNFVTSDNEYQMKFEVSKLTKVSVNKKFFHMDELPDGRWRITYNGNMFETTEDIKYIEIIRED